MPQTHFETIGGIVNRRGGVLANHVAGDPTTKHVTGVSGIGIRKKL